MKIIADENMSGVQAIFSPYGEVETLPGRNITAAAVATADVLLVRSVTNVEAQLLEGSRVQFVGSATIGTDHIDLQYLQQKGIHFAHAPGCNAEAVVQYMFSVFCTLEPQWRDKTVGIVGCGNVGGRLYRRLSGLGVSCVVYDPFLSDAECPSLADLEATLSADIICLHTPLTREGPHPSYHLVDRKILEEHIRPGALLINASRGGVIDNAALYAHLKMGANLKVALDVWENEPHISLALMGQVKIATPHIAGYSQEGRLRGTQMVRDALCRFLGLNTLSDQAVDLRIVSGERVADTLMIEDEEGLDQAILATYQVAQDDQNMRRALIDKLGNSEGEIGRKFDALRKHYAQRREFGYYTASGPGEPACHGDLELLGFNTR